MPVATDLDFPVVQSLHGNAGAGTGVSRNRTAKQVTEVGSIGLGLGVQATSIATGSSVIAAMGGATIATGGIALIAGGAAIAVGSAAASGRSAKKTYDHIYALNNLHNFKDSLDFSCTHVNSGANTKKSPAHEYISGEILNYIIHQKTHKFGKKSVGAVGGGLATGVWALGRLAYKTARGTKGEKRNLAAQMLAAHLITHHCVLTERIAAELLSLSPDELEWIKAQDSDVVGTLLAAKMKSK